MRTHESRLRAIEKTHAQHQRRRRQQGDATERLDAKLDDLARRLAGHPVEFDETVMRTRLAELKEDMQRDS